MEKEEIVFIAIKKLREVKKLPINFVRFKEDKMTYDTITIYNSSTNFNDEILFNDIAFSEPVRMTDSEEPTHLPWEELLILRIAKIIYEYYKNHLDLKSHQPSLTASTLTASTLAASNTLHVSDVCISGVSYSDKVRDLEDKIQELEYERVKLSTELRDTRKMVEDLLLACQAKGVL